MLRSSSFYLFAVFTLLIAAPAFGVDTPASNGSILVTNPSGVFVDVSHNAYVTSTSQNKVIKFNPNGVTSNVYNAETSGLSSPYAITGDGAGNVYVTNAAFGGAVRKLLSNEATFNSFIGGLNAPEGIWVNGSGTVYVSAYASDSVRSFSSGTVPLTQNTGNDFFKPVGIAGDSNGNTYVACQQDLIVKKVSSQGVVLDDNYLGTFTSPPSSDHVDAFDNLYVTTVGGDPAVYKYNSSGIRQYKLSLLSGSPTSQPLGVTTDSDGRLYVADAAKNQVSIFSQLTPMTALAAETSGHSVTLNWTNAGAHRVKIRRSQDAFPIFSTDGSEVASFNAISTYTDTVAVNGTYYYSVFAADDGIYSSNLGLQVQVDAAPAPVTGLVVMSNGRQVQLSWTPPSQDYSGFTICRSTSAFVTTPVTGIVADNVVAPAYSETVTGDGTFYYTVFAKSTFGGAYSLAATKSLSIDTTAPGAVTNVSANVIGHSVNLNWAKPTAGDFSGVRIQRSNTAFVTTIDNQALVSQNISTENYTDTVTGDATYYYSLFAKDDAGNYSTVTTKSVLVDTLAPARPSNFTVALSATNNVRLEWVKPESDFLSVQIRRSTDVFPVTVADGDLVTRNNTATTFTDPNLADGSYKYAIFSRDTFGNFSEAATASIRVDTTAPTFPSGLTATVNRQTVTLTWENPRDLDFASVKVLRSPTAVPATISDGEILIRDVKISSYVDTNLGNRTYYYAVFAEDADHHLSRPVTANATVNFTFANSGVAKGDVSITATVNLPNTPVVVGDDSVGSVTIAGGSLSNKNTIVGNQPGVVGTVAVNAPTVSSIRTADTASTLSSWTVLQNLTVGKQGIGRVVQQTGSVTIGGDILLADLQGSSGNYQMQGGTLSAASIGAGSGAAAFTWTGGTVETRQFKMSVTNSGFGTLLMPTGANSIQVSGNYTQSGSANLILNLSAIHVVSLLPLAVASSLEGLDPTYALGVTGTLTAGGQLTLNVDASVTPSAGQEYKILAAGQISGAFDTLTLPSLPSGLAWDSSKLYTTGMLRILGDACTTLISGKALVYPNPSRAKDGAQIGYLLGRDADMSLRVYTDQGFEVYRASFLSGQPGGVAGYNKVPINKEKIGVPLRSGGYIVLLISDNKVVGKIKMAVLP